MKMLMLCLLMLGARADGSFPSSSQAIVGNFRVQMLSPTLVRVEEKGPRGWEDRETFMAVGRSSFPGVKITGSKAMPDGSTELTTDHYVVAVTPPAPQPPHNKDTCSDRMSTA